MMEAIALLAGLAIACLFVYAGLLTLALANALKRITDLEKTAAMLSPDHRVESVEKRIGQLETLVTTGFQATANTLKEIGAATILALTAAQAVKKDTEENYIRKGDVN